MTTRNMGGDLRYLSAEPQATAVAMGIDIVSGQLNNEKIDTDLPHNSITQRMT